MEKLSDSQVGERFRELAGKVRVAERIEQQRSDELGVAGSVHMDAMQATSSAKRELASFVAQYTRLEE